MTELTKRYGCSSAVADKLQKYINYFHYADEIKLNIDPFKVFAQKPYHGEIATIKSIEIGNYSFNGNMYYLANPEKEKLFFGIGRITNINKKQYPIFEDFSIAIINKKVYPHPQRNEPANYSSNITGVQVIFPSFKIRGAIIIDVIYILSNIVNLILYDKDHFIEFHATGLRAADTQSCPYLSFPVAILTGVLKVGKFSLLTTVNKIDATVNNVKIDLTNFWNAFTYDQAQINRINCELENLTKDSDVLDLVFNLPVGPEIITIIYNGNKNKRKYDLDEPK